MINIYFSRLVKRRVMIVYKNEELIWFILVMKRISLSGRVLIVGGG